MLSYTKLPLSAETELLSRVSHECYTFGNGNNNKSDANLFNIRILTDHMPLQAPKKIKEGFSSWSGRLNYQAINQVHLETDHK